MYVIGSDDNGKSYLVYIDIYTGSILLYLTVAQSIYSSFIIGNDNTVYFSSHNSIFRLNGTNGDTLFRTTFTSSEYFFTTSAIDIDNNILIQPSQSGFIYTININTGSFIWKYRFDYPVDAVPTIDNNNNVYIHCDDGYLYSLSSITGSYQWSFYTNNSNPDIDPYYTYFSSSATIDKHGYIYIGSTNGMLYTISSSSTLSPSLLPTSTNNNNDNNNKSLFQSLNLASKIATIIGIILFGFCLGLLCIVIYNNHYYNQNMNRNHSKPEMINLEDSQQQYLNSLNNNNNDMNKSLSNVLGNIGLYNY
jgi:hypothetical protein